MKPITPNELARLIAGDPALREALRACPDAQTAAQTAQRLLAERGCRLVQPGMTALSDDRIAAVAGGFDPRQLDEDPDLNPYSWFVTIMRRLIQGDEDAPV